MVVEVQLLEIRKKSTAMDLSVNHSFWRRVVHKPDKNCLIFLSALPAQAPLPLSIQWPPPTPQRIFFVIWYEAAIPVRALVVTQSRASP